jgi:hypothetical protein
LLLLQIAKIRIPAKAENIVKIMIGRFIFDICISYLFYFDLLDIGFVHFLCINQSSLLSSQEWKINCNKCDLGHTLKFNAKELSDLFQNGFIDIRCNSNTNIPKIPKPPSLPMNPRRNFSDQGQVQPKHTITITLHSLIQTYLQ